MRGISLSGTKEWSRNCCYKTLKCYQFGRGTPIHRSFDYKFIYLYIRNLNRARQFVTHNHSVNRIFKKFLPSYRSQWDLIKARVMAMLCASILVWRNIRTIFLEMYQHLNPQPRMGLGLSFPDYYRLMFTVVLLLLHPQKRAMVNLMTLASVSLCTAKFRSSKTWSTAWVVS